MSQPKLIVAHLGARLHYAVAELMHRKGFLHHFYTDTFLPADGIGTRMMERVPERFMPGPLRKLKTRTAKIPSSQTTAFQQLGLAYQRALRNHPSTDTFLSFNRQFGKMVASDDHFRDGNMVYGFTGSSLEIFRAAKAEGMTCILEQMSAPVATSTRVIEDEMARWPGWQEEVRTTWDLEQWSPREAEEWELADVIIAPSAYVAEQLEQAGVDSAKVQTIPFAVSADRFQGSQRSFDGSRPLRVLYIGALRLLKGTPYLLEGLAALPPERVASVVIGQNHLAPQKLEPYRQHIEIKGQIPRSELADYYKWADLFVMPSLCEGSATVNYEARASGLPVVATFTSGTWIEHGREGLIIPSRDAEAITHAISSFLTEPQQIAEMSEANLVNRSDYTWEAYEQRLAELVEGL